MNKKYGAFSSSVNPEKFSRTWAGIIQFVPLLLLVSKFYGTPLGETEVMEFLSAVKDMIMIVYAFVAGAQTVLGLGRKIYLKYDW